MQMAYDALVKMQTPRQKHVIIISDGDPAAAESATG